jgi:hypothetical protein
VTREVLLQLIRGKGAHVDSVSCVSVPYAVAATVPPGFPHSVAQVVEHCVFWIDYELRRIEGRPRPYPTHASESWPQSPSPGSDAAWQEALGRFREALDRMAALVREGPATLARGIGSTDQGDTAPDLPVEAVLWQLVVHTSYHVGQVAQIRRALGAWPPPEGGDTW